MVRGLPYSPSSIPYLQEQHTQVCTAHPVMHKGLAHGGYRNCKTVNQLTSQKEF